MSSILSSLLLQESITHLEDLPLKEFIRTVETLKDKVVTEKLDGSNLWFGVDENGLFTSREGKSPKKGRFYDVSDYPMVANYNGFRAAHLAFEKAAPVIKRYLDEGDMVEVEVLFGRQPNTVTYGVNDKNFIVILRGVNGTPDDRVKALANAVNKKTVTVESTIVTSPDGNELEFDDEQVKWEFTSVAPLDTKKVDTSYATDLLKQLKKFMTLKNDVLKDKTNEEVAELSMNKVPKDQREAVKAERDKVIAHIQNNFKIPIKEMLLGKFVRKIKPFLQDANLHPSEDIGVEGVVVRDPVTGSQTKIVDKDVFTAINTFNSSVRNNIAGLVRTTDQDATIEMRGGAFGQAKIRIAELMGAKELAMSSGVKRFITKFKAESAQATAEALAKSLNIASFGSTKTKISSILKNAISEVNAILESFKKEAGEYKLKLKTGKEIGITPEIMKRTLTAFAETKKDINDVNAKVLHSSSPAELVMALYGKTIENIFEGADDVKESFSFLKSLQEDDGAVDTGTGGMGDSGITGAAQTADVSSKTTSSDSIAALPKMLMKGGKMITRRARKFKAISKFPVPKLKQVEEGKFSLLKSMNEDWAHVSDMKFATDVDDQAGAKGDVEFNQLRNNVNIGDKVTQMDVSRYLDKAHDLNDEVDTVTFGMETDDGKVAKVYVAATQAEEFEKALSELLGKEDDLETVINDLAGKYDIVDVEWPEGYVSASTGETLGQAAPENDMDLNDEGEPDIHLGLEDGTQNPEDDELSSQDSSENDTTVGDDNSDNADETEAEDDIKNDADSELDLSTEPDTSDAEEKNDEDESEELDVSDDGGDEGEEKPKKKKKKKKKKDEDIDLSMNDVEEASRQVGAILGEDDGEEAVTSLLTNLDIDTTKPIAQQVNNPKTKLALKNLKAKNPSLMQQISKLDAANKPKPTNGMSNTIPSVKPPSLTGPVSEEVTDQGRWIVGQLGSGGLMLKVTGLTIKIDEHETEKLKYILEKHKSGSVKNGSDVRFLFKPIEDGCFAVKKVADESEFPEGIFMSRKQVEEILEMLD